MKKKLFLFLIGVSISGFAQAQNVITENFETFTLGNLVPDASGTLGQSSFFANKGLVSDYQVVSIDAAHGNSIQVKSGIDNTENSDRYAFKNIAVTASPENNITKVSLEIFTGMNNGNGITEFILYDANNVGIVGIGYDYESKQIVGKGRFVLLGQQQPFFATVVMPNGPGNTQYSPNTWVSVSFSYDKSTGAFLWTNPDGTFFYPDNTVVPVAGLTPVKFSIGAKAGSSNSMINTGAIDNIKMEFTNTLLSTNDIDTNKSEISIYPNPVTDILHIKAKSAITNIEIYDISGRKISNVKLSENNRLNLKDLKTGNYIVTIETKEGKTSKQVIKK